MKSKSKYFFMVLWLVFFSIAFAVAWPKLPWLGFLDLPESVWIYLMDATASYGGERSSNLVVYVGLGYGLVFASIIMAFFIFLKKKMKS